MTTPRFLITFEKTRSRDFMDPHPDFSVHMNDERIGDLTYTPSGYTGHLINVRGELVNNEASTIAEWESARKSINEEAERLISSSHDDPYRVIHAHHTWDKRVMRISNGNDERFVPLVELEMAEKVFGRGGVPWKFCRSSALYGPMREARPETIAELLLRSALAADDVSAFLRGVSSGDRPSLNVRTREALMNFLQDEGEDDVLSGAKSWFLVWIMGAYPETTGEFTERFLIEIDERNVWVDDMPGYEPALRVRALRLDDAIAILRGVRSREELGGRRATGLLSDKERILLRRVMTLCDDMGPRSPLLRVDLDMVRAVREIAKRGG